MTLARMLAAVVAVVALSVALTVAPASTAAAEGTEPPALVTVAIGPSVVGALHSQQLAASGGDVTFSLAPGAPAGMTVTADGFLEWAPPSAGAFGVEIVVRNAAGESSQRYTFSVAAAPGELAPDAPAGVIDLPTLSDPGATVQQAANPDPDASGPSGATTSAVISGSALLVLLFIVGLALIFRTRFSRA